MKQLYILALLFPLFAFSSLPYRDNSVLSEGNWWKIAVSTTGIHQITYQDITSLNIDPLTIDPAKLRLYGNGGNMLPEGNQSFRVDDLREIAIQVIDGNDGKFDPGDYILFYATGTTGWDFNYQTSIFSHNKNLYSDKSFYFLTISDQPGKRINQQIPSDTIPEYFSQAFTDHVFYEKDSVSLIKSGKVWIGELFNANKSIFSLNFNFPSIVSNYPVRIVSSVVAKSSKNSSFKVFVDDFLHDSIKVEFVDPGSVGVYARIKMKNTLIFVPDSQFSVKYIYTMPNPDAQGWLDYTEIICRRQLKFHSPQLAFRDHLSIKNNQITKFSMSNTGGNVKVWDVTQEADVFEVHPNLSDSTFSFIANTDTLREFVAFDALFFHPVELVGKVENQNLHGLTADVTLVIVTHPLFYDQAVRLANFHKQETGINSHVVDIYDIYNEFSSGKKDITSIRDFMKMLYDKASSSEKPKYLLLFGDGSYDPKERTPGNNDLIPTFQSFESFKPVGTYVTDDYYGIMSGTAGYESSGSIDIGIGRFPVSTVAEAKIVVDKIYNYTSGSDTILSDWRNVITFIADDENSNLHMHQAEELARIVQEKYPVYNVNKIYLDAYKMIPTPAGPRLPEVNAAINNAMEKGTLILNYTGHGGEDGWSGEKVLTLGDIRSWKNYNKLPVIVTATCEFSRFDNPERFTAGEMVLLQPNGGAIALYSTTRLALATSNFKLDTSFFRNLIPADGSKLTMGDLIRISKNRNNNNYMIRNFVLLGDPAQHIAFPEYEVVATNVNNKPVDEIADTLLGMSSVTIKGEIREKSGEKLTSFNGRVFPKFLDKPASNLTIGNTDDSYPELFNTQKSILYSGVAEVKNGEFEFSFVVPVGVSLPVNKGKLSLYAHNGNVDANGYSTNIATGGKDPNATPDQQGPDISLYMDNTLFDNGGITGENPTLLAFFEDQQGINYINLGIGHEITMLIDGKGDQLVLNDAYMPELGNFTKGNLEYALSNLSPGKHILLLKAWDMYNNSSTKEIFFFVNEKPEQIIKTVSNYPNPFVESTTFSFLPEPESGSLDIMISIYSLAGSPIKSINFKLEANPGSHVLIKWDGTDENNFNVSSGIYFYTLTAKNSKGNSTRINSKLVKID